MGSLTAIYDYYKDKPISGYRFYGAPGTALREPSSAASDEDYQSWVKGRIGEKLFMSIASEKGLLNKCVSFWSLVFDENWDLDCAFLFDDALIVVDIKSWTDTTIGKNPRGLQKTVDTLKSCIENHDVARKIVPYIVFVPTIGQELHDSVKYSNGIEGLKYNAFFQTIAETCSSSFCEDRETLDASSWLESYLGGMVDNRPSISFGDAGDEVWDNKRWARSYRDLFQKLGGRA